MADTGWKAPGTAANVDRDDGGQWFEVNEVKTDNDFGAYVTSKDDYSDWIRCSNYSFSVPSGATIDGIEVRIKRKESEGSTGSIYDDSLRLWNGSSVVGDDKASGTPYPSSFTTATYGSSTDDWNASLSVATINSSGFGVQLSVYADGPFPAAEVDVIEMKIHYTESGGGGSVPQKGRVIFIGV